MGGGRLDYHTDLVFGCSGTVDVFGVEREGRGGCGWGAEYVPCAVGGCCDGRFEGGCILFFGGGHFVVIIGVCEVEYGCDADDDDGDN